MRVAASWRKDRRRRIQRANRRLPSGASKPETAMGRLTRCLAEFRDEVKAVRGRECQAWARVTDVEAFARVTREKVDLVQEAGSRERLARLMVAEKMRTMKTEQRVTNMRVGDMEAGLLEAKRVMGELREAIEAAEVEFARTDCGSRSCSSVGSEASVGEIGGGREGASLSGAQGTDEKMAGEMVGEMVAEEHVAMEGGGFRLIRRDVRGDGAGGSSTTLGHRTGRHCQQGEEMMRG